MMQRSTAQESEFRKLERILSFRLPNSFFRIGIATFLIAFVVLIALKLVSGDYELIRHVTRNFLLVGLLMSSLARDEVEDEMTVSLRAKSYSAAFVIGVVYAVVQPFIDFGVDKLIDPANSTFEEAEILPVLIFMLLIQVFFYQLLKRGCPDEK